MKKNIWIIVAIVVIVLIGGGILANQYNWFAGNPSPSPLPSPDITADWKTYRNDEYGFEMKYPGNFEMDLKNVIETYEKGTNLGYEWPRLIIEPESLVSEYDLSREQYKAAKESRVFAKQGDSMGFNVIYVSSRNNRVYFNCYLYQSLDIEICNQILSTFRFTK